MKKIEFSTGELESMR